MNQVNVTSIPKSLIKRSKIHISTKGTFYKRLECPHLSISLTFLYGYRERDGFSQTGRFSKRSSSFWITDWSLIEERIAYKRILLLLYGLLESLWHWTASSAHAKLEALFVPVDIEWRIYAMYESVSRILRFSIGLSEVVAGTIGVKLGCPLSPTLSGLFRYVKSIIW